MKDNEQDDTAVADIISTLVVLSRGNFVIDCGRELQELTDAIVDTQKEGSLTIKLKVKPSGLRKGKVNQCEFAPEVSIAKPKHDQPKSLFFLTDEGKLVRDDPDQMNLDMREERSNVRK